MTRRIIKWIYFLLLFFLPLSQNFSQTIKSIEIKGASNFSENDYLTWIKISPGKSMFKGISDTLQNRIRNSLFNRGYYNFKLKQIKFVFSPDSQNVNLIIKVNEGEPTYIDSIKIENLSKADSQTVYSKFVFLNGSIFYKSDLIKSINELLDYFENNGYPFASVIIKSIYFFKDSTKNKNYVNIFLKLNKGKFSTINRVEITGNYNTKAYVIIRNIRLHKNEKYSQKLIDEIPRQLNKLGFFASVSKPTFYFNSRNQGVLKIKVKEKQTNHFDGIIGYVPAIEANKKGFFTGYVNISLRNLFGTGRAAAIRWQQLDKYSQELDLKYLEPWVLNYPFNLQLELFQRKQDTTYIQRRLTGSLSYLATENISAIFSVATQTTIPTINRNKNFTVFNSNSFSTGLSVKIDTRDNIYAPTRGVLFLNSYQYSRKKINGPKKYITTKTNTNISLQHFELNLGLFFELFKKQILALGFHLREVRGSLLEISDLYRLGGANSLRGYRENQFFGNRIIWSNFEYRYLFNKRNYTFIFFDTGYFLKNGNLDRNITKQSGFKTGYGIGFSLESGLGMLSVSYAIAGGNSLSQGVIHFGIKNEF